jgi:hypothetical protein
VILKWPWWVPTNKVAAAYVAFYIYYLMTMIVPDDEEFANRWKRVAVNTYPTRGNYGSLSFPSSCTIEGVRNLEEEEERRKKRNKKGTVPRNL